MKRGALLWGTWTPSTPSPSLGASPSTCWATSGSDCAAHVSLNTRRLAIAVLALLLVPLATEPPALVVVALVKVPLGAHRRRDAQPWPEPVTTSATRWSGGRRRLRRGSLILVPVRWAECGLLRSGQAVNEHPRNRASNDPRRWRAQSAKRKVHHDTAPNSELEVRAGPSGPSSANRTGSQGRLRPRSLRPRWRTQKADDLLRRVRGELDQLRCRSPLSRSTGSRKTAVAPATTAAALTRRWSTGSRDAPSSAFMCAAR